MSIHLCADVDVTPKQVAELFWGMDSDQQAQFFYELYQAIQRSHESGETRFSYDEYADMQWRYLRDGIKKLGKEDQLKAANMVRALSADFWQYLLAYSGRESWDWERMEHQIR